MKAREIKFATEPDRKWVGQIELCPFCGEEISIASLNEARALNLKLHIHKGDKCQN